MLSNFVWKSASTFEKRLKYLKIGSSQRFHDLSLNFNGWEHNRMYVYPIFKIYKHPTGRIDFYPKIWVFFYTISDLYNIIERCYEVFCFSVCIRSYEGCILGWCRGETTFNQLGSEQLIEHLPKCNYGALYLIKISLTLCNSMCLVFKRSL